jgi:polar amino acid transport system permease protein
MTLNFSQLWRYEDLLAQGTLMTLLLTVIAAGAGTLIGVGGAVLVRGGPRPVRWAIRGYIEVIRNTPALIQLFIIFFVLPSLGLRLPPFEAAAVALSIYFGAYAIEIIRAGLDAIPRAQLEAGQCLGLTRWQVLRHIVLLPALRTIYPAFTSQFVLLLLGTSLASQVSAEELFHVGGFIESRTFRSFEVYAVICAIYFALVMAFKLAFAGLERLIFRWPMRR